MAGWATLRLSAFVIPEAVGQQGHSRAQGQKAKQSLFDDPAFAHGYRAAYSAVYDRTDYASAIEQLKTLGHDDHPNVANLIGYSYRKLGDYEQSQVWYERALKTDPNHVLTWQYYGLWQIERATASKRSITSAGLRPFAGLAARSTGRWPPR
ncbi:tetratricopeptide repeat protein [Bradyrhizobium japonicum]